MVARRVSEGIAVDGHYLAHLHGLSYVVNGEPQNDAHFLNAEHRFNPHPPLPQQSMCAEIANGR